MKTWNIILFLALGAVIALLLMMKCGKDPVKPDMKEPKVIEKEVIKYVDTYKAKYDSLYEVMRTKSERHTINKSKLSSAQADTRDKEKIISDFIFENSPNDYAGGDPFKEWNDLVRQKIYSDSLCNETVNNLELLIADKDTLIKAKSLFESQLRIALDTTLANYKESLAYNKSLKKQAKKGKAKVLIYGGAAATAVIFSIKVLLSK